MLACPQNTTYKLNYPMGQRDLRRSSPTSMRNFRLQADADAALQLQLFIEEACDGCTDTTGNFLIVAVFTLAVFFWYSTLVVLVMLTCPADEIITRFHI